MFSRKKEEPKPEEKKDVKEEKKDPKEGGKKVEDGEIPADKAPEILNVLFLYEFY